MPSVNRAITIACIAIQFAAGCAVSSTPNPAANSAQSKQIEPYLTDLGCEVEHLDGQQSRELLRVRCPDADAHTRGLWHGQRVVRVPDPVYGGHYEAFVHPGTRVITYLQWPDPAGEPPVPVLLSPVRSLAEIVTDPVLKQRFDDAVGDATDCSPLRFALGELLLDGVLAPWSGCDAVMLADGSDCGTCTARANTARDELPVELAHLVDVAQRAGLGPVISGRDGGDWLVDIAITFEYFEYNRNWDSVARCACGRMGFCGESDRSGGP